MRQKGSNPFCLPRNLNVFNTNLLHLKTKATVHGGHSPLSSYFFFLHFFLSQFIHFLHCIIGIPDLMLMIIKQLPCLRSTN